MFDSEKMKTGDWKKPQHILSFVFLWMILSLLFTIFFAPYREMKHSLLFDYKLYHLILLSLQRVFLKGILISGAVLVISSLAIRKFRDFILRLFDNMLAKSLSLILLMVVLWLNASVVLRQVRTGPNIVLFVVDTLRSDYTAVGDESSLDTPYLKSRLMPDSVTFKKAYANSPWTLPSVSSLLTSQYPSRLNITNLVSRLDESNLTMAELIKNKGYSTCAVISHLLLKKNYGISQGFDEFNERNISEEFYNHYAVSSPGVSEDAIRYIQKHKRRKFFLFLHYFDPHYIYIDHKKSAPYSGEFTSRDIGYLRDLIREKKYTEQDIDYLKRSYRSEIELTDSWIGKVIDELKTQDIYDNTLIVFTSDHGEEFLERGWLGHSTSVYDEQIKIPLLIKLPAAFKIVTKTSVDYPVSNLDIAPTVLGVLDVGIPRFFQGRDLFSNLLEDPFVFSEVTQRDYGDFINKACVISGGWKLIKNYVDDAFELYNLVENGAETTNLDGIDGDIVRSLKMNLAKWEKTNRMQRKTRTEREALSKEERERLKSLGYIK